MIEIMEYKSEFKGPEIDALLKQGVPIVESVDALDADAALGSIACVAKLGSISETSVRDLYQPTADMIDQSTGTLTSPELLSSVSSVKVLAPEGTISGKSFGFYIVPRTFSMQNRQMLAPAIQCTDGVVTMVGAMAMTPAGYEQLTFISYTGGVPTVDQAAIDKFNAYLSTDDDWCYLGNPEGGFVITEEQFNLLDKFFKVVAGISTISSLFIKKEEDWKELAVKEELDVLRTEFNAAKVKIKENYPVEEISNYTSSIEIEPNTYYRTTAKRSSNLSVTFAEPSENGIVNEYVFEIACSKAFTLTLPEGVVWANDVAPEIAAGKTYVISVVNNLAVFAEFTTA